MFVTFFENRTLKKEGREAEKKVKQLSAIQNTVIKKTQGGITFISEKLFDMSKVNTACLMEILSLSIEYI